MADHPYPPRPIEEMWANTKDLTDLSEAEFRQFHADRVERQNFLPKIGALAPEFALEALDADGRPSGETISLASRRGKPLGLAFGSFT